MKVTIRSATHAFKKQIAIPGSKSITNRALLLSALAAGNSTLHNILRSDDTIAFANALQALGVELHADPKNNRCDVVGVAGKFPAQHSKIWCRDAGTAARFLLSACAQARGSFYFDATPRLRERPIAELITVLKQQGAKFSPDNAQAMPFQIQGVAALEGGEIFIPADESSQFLSGLLMVAPHMKNTATFFTENMVSKTYVAMTCRMMQQFGVSVEQLSAEKFVVKTPQHYVGRDYIVEPDLSTASYFFAAAALTQSEITISHINRQDCLQGDIRFLEVLEKIGCDVVAHEDSVTVRGPQQLKGIEIDMNEFSDTFMTLACLASFCDSPVTIRNIKHVRLQESDRLQATHDNLQKLKIKSEIGEDWITIYPSQPEASAIHSHHDHRIAMSFSLIGLRVPGVVIEEAECVAKTCPDFFERWEQLLN